MGFARPGYRYPTSIRDQEASKANGCQGRRAREPTHRGLAGPGCGVRPLLALGRIPYKGLLNLGCLANREP